MKRKNHLQPFLLLILSIISLNVTAQFKVIGYLPNWGNLATASAAVDYSKVTHINIAFINPINTAGDLGPTTGLATAVQLAHDNNVKVLISLAGANLNATLWADLQTDAKRAGFVAKILQFTLDYNLDGVDVDLEGSNIGSDYEKFIVDLSAALKPNNKLLSAAVAQWNGYAISTTALAEFDFINLMAYDVTGNWAPNNPGQHSPYSKATSDLYYWGTTRGVAASKMNLGVPFYGYDFNTTNNTAGSMTYKQIVTAYPGAENQDKDTIATGHYVWYNGIPTIQDKTTLALNQAGGIMIWELTQDFATSDSRSLLRAIDDVIQSSINNVLPIASITSPANNDSYTEEQTITITADATDSDGTISKVVFYSGTFKIGEDATAPYSVDWTGAGSGNYSITAKAFDNSHGEATSPAISITVGPGNEAPYGGTPWPIPGKIEAEDFDLGGNNVSYYDLSANNQGGGYRLTYVDIEPSNDVNGGYNIGWTEAGEWLNYSVNVTTDTTYDISVRVACTTTGKKFHIEIDNIDVTGSINVPNTGGWQNWQTVNINAVPITTGDKIVKFVFDLGDFNLNNIDFREHTVLGITKTQSAFSNIKVQPNPFTYSATINVSLVNSGETEIILYDQLGKEVTTLLNEYLTAGVHDININASSLEKGFYFCKLIQNNEVQVLKLVRE